MTESPAQHTRPIIAVMGPTASGKSHLGIELALRFDGEIINCDSVQVYREIETATAKVPPEERRGVPHHLLDFVPPHVRYSAGDWARDARRVIAETEARARLPIIVGGTGLYLRALRRPFSLTPPTDERLRLRLTRLRERRGAEHLHRMLRRLDSATALRLHPADWSRVTRALEVCFTTGRTLSEIHAAHRATPVEKDEIADRLYIIALDPPREELYRRIERRTLEHFRLGLIEEVRDLIRRGVRADSSALGAHGYRRAVEHLQGRRSLEDAVLQTQRDVRHYAKRQWTWFRREPGVEWVEGFGDDPAVVAHVAERVATLLRASDGHMPS